MGVVPLDRDVDTGPNTADIDAVSATDGQLMQWRDGGTRWNAVDQQAVGPLSMLNFVTDTRGGPTRRAQILAGTSAGDDSAAVQAAIDYALLYSPDKSLYVPGGFVCASDITSLHDVHLWGPGWLEIGTGGRWYVEANQINTGFGDLDFNTLYVDETNGDDANSGLAPEFAVKYGDRAMAILSVQGSPLQGYYQVQFLEGVVTAETNTNDVETLGDNPLYIFGASPDSEWDNTDEPDDELTINNITAANPPVVTVSGVEYITVTNGGSGYTSAPTVGFSGGAGSGAVAVALVESGAVTMVVVTTKGTGYTSAPTVSFTGGGGSSAAATARIGHNMNNGDKVFLGLVTKSGGAHESDGKIYTVANKTATTFELSGINGSTWSAITGGKGWRLHKSRPKTVIYGTGDDFVGIDVTRNTYADVRNFFGVNCGKTSGTDNGAVVKGSESSKLICRNVHAARCQVKFFIRDHGSRGFDFGGMATDCWAMQRAISCEYTFGSANTYALSTTTPKAKRCLIAMETWEMSNGHADAQVYQDCTYVAYVWKNSQMSANYSQHINTGARVSKGTGYVVSSSGYAAIDLDNSTNVWRGSWKRIDLRSYASLNVTTETAYSWRTMDTTQLALTPAGGEITVLQLAMAQDTFGDYPQGWRIMSRGTGTNANGNLVWRIKKGSTTLYSRTISSNASAREIRHDFSAVMTGFGGASIDMIEHLLTGSTTTVAYDIAAVSFDMTTANDTLSLTVEVVHASDTHTVRHSALETMGC